MRWRIAGVGGKKDIKNKACLIHAAECRRTARTGELAVWLIVWLNWLLRSSFTPYAPLSSGMVGRSIATPQKANASRLRLMDFNRTKPIMVAHGR